MALKVDIANITSSVNGDILNVSAVANIYDDSAPETVLYSRSISAKGNFNDANMKAILINKLVNEGKDLLAKYQQKMAIIQGFYPEAGTPQEAMALLEQEVENGINS